MTKHPNLKRALLLAPLAAITLAACGGGSKAAPTTTQAPATTSAPTTAAPTTTTAAKTLTRDAKLAVQRCLDNLNMPGPSVLPADLSVLDDDSSSDKTMADCDEAMRQVELDVPASMLAVDLAEINLAVAQLKGAWARGESVKVGSPAAEAYYTKMTPAIAGAMREVQKLS